MNLEPVVAALASAGSGFGCAILFAKYALAKTLADLDRVAQSVQQIRESLAAVAVKLAVIEEHEAILKDHAKRLAFYEGVDARATRYGRRDS